MCVLPIFAKLFCTIFNDPAVVFAATPKPTELNCGKDAVPNCPAVIVPDSCDVGKIIDVFVTELIRPAASTLKTGIAVVLPCVADTTPVMFKFADVNRPVTLVFATDINALAAEITLPCASTWNVVVILLLPYTPAVTPVIAKFADENKPVTCVFAIDRKVFCTERIRPAGSTVNVG